MEAKVLGAEDRGAGPGVRALRGGAASRSAEHLDALGPPRPRPWRCSTCCARLAEVAVERGYVRPVVDDGAARWRSSGGRHPVVEASLSGERFVPNDVRLAPSEAQLLIITGPNMAGKSTILRQVALIVLLAQMGSLRAGARARAIGVVDRIFTRVGASDDLARGRSTFMVEMNETANILHNATAAQPGRSSTRSAGAPPPSTASPSPGPWPSTSTSVGARTLFATHYHELTDLARTLRGVANFNVAVKEWDGAGDLPAAPGGGGREPLLRHPGGAAGRAARAG